MSFTVDIPQHHTRKPWTHRFAKLLIVGSGGVVQPHHLPAHASHIIPLALLSARTFLTSQTFLCRVKQLYAGAFYQCQALT